MQKRQSHEIIIQICLQQYELFADEIDIGLQRLQPRPSPSGGKTQKETVSFYHFVPVNRVFLHVEAPTKPKECNVIGSLEQTRDLHTGRSPVTSLPSCFPIFQVGAAVQELQRGSLDLPLTSLFFPSLINRDTSSLQAAALL